MNHDHKVRGIHAIRLRGETRRNFASAAKLRLIHVFRVSGQGGREKPGASILENERWRV